MMSRKYRVRFAPSPTGDLHVGNARTALFNWLFAKHYGGRFILRIEDTDQERTSRIFERNLLEDLKWLSLYWDEGPEKGGEFGPYHQIERLPLYSTYLKKLIADERVYPCYCTEEELEAERLTLLSMKMMPRYMGKCRNLTDSERKSLETKGRNAAFRFKVKPGSIEFDDLIRGSMKFEGEAIGDFIIVRSNGIPSYNFAVVIDDHLMEITHVIRGEDHLSNTAIQILLYGALGFTPPSFAHHSLILGRDRSKLSKRHGSVSVREFRKKGILPKALLNYLSLLGGSLGEGKEFASLDEIIDMFSLERAGKSGAIFDESKLKWLNAMYIRDCDVETLIELLSPFLKKAGYDPDLLDHTWLHQVVDAVKDNIVTLNEISGYIDMFVDEKYHVSREAAEILRGNTVAEILKALHEVLTQSEISRKNFYSTLIHSVREKTGLKAKSILMPLRAAVTGRTSGPELEKIFSILGKESILKRLEQARQFMEM
ncbi:MAG: glutamate--tRNA ligase [Deltaproteobacteria bacterium]|jgi:nondiscriminating glutamyl-tRNA synthetase|nr:glutamate--tRNA ligase [Deltaproteobacteria bacterium]